MILAGDATQRGSVAEVQEETDAVIGTSELLLRVLARATPGDDPETVVRETIADYRRNLGASRIRIIRDPDFPESLSVPFASSFGEAPEHPAGRLEEIGRQ